MSSLKLLCLLCAVLSAANAVLQTLNDDFGFLSNVTHRRLVFQAVLHQFYLRIHNSALLEEFGRRIAVIQSRDAALLEDVMAVEGEDCRMEGLRLRDRFVLDRNEEVRNCAERTWGSLNELGKEFWPKFEPFTRDATQAAYQVVRTLGGVTDLLDGEGLVAELVEELERYRTMGDEQLAMLEGEVRVQQGALEPMKNSLRECLDSVELMQIGNHETIMDLLGNCHVYK